MGQILACMATAMKEIYGIQILRISDERSWEEGRKTMQGEFEVAILEHAKDLAS